jgi:dTDP-4-amino-4,6-dideoxygalactose transaminase
MQKYSSNNAHMFYLVCKSLRERDKLILKLKRKNIMAVFHYQSLHESDFFKSKHDNRVLLNSNEYSNRLVRLPFYFDLMDSEILNITNAIYEVFEK